jgi:hypothetical protein
MKRQRGGNKCKGEEAKRRGLEKEVNTLLMDDPIQMPSLSPLKWMIPWSRVFEDQGSPTNVIFEQIVQKISLCMKKFPVSIKKIEGLAKEETTVIGTIDILVTFEDGRTA